MQLFFHNVGLEGANRDFPKTVFNRIPISIAEKSIPVDAPYRIDLIRGLKDKFPSGSFNCWGVPAGAKNVINRLKVGDAILLIKTIGGLYGEIPALGIIKVFVNAQMRELSEVLWGEIGYPYIFFFDTLSLDLSWTDFRDTVGYPTTYRPPAIVSRVAKLENLQAQFNGIEGYLNFLLRHDQKQVNNNYSSQTLPKTQLDETSPPSSKVQRKSTKEKISLYKTENYTENDLINCEIGLAGELLVLQHEKACLLGNGHSELAEKVRHISQIDGDGLGYDILSFSSNGQEKYIEVKTTSGKAETPFYLTQNELAFSEQNYDKYYIYRVYNFDKFNNTAKFYVHRGKLSLFFALDPIKYRATIL